MPRPRIYKTNAERQAAYRERKAKAERAPVDPGKALTKRIMDAEARARA